MTYSETLDYLFNAMPMFQAVGGDAYKPGLDRTEAFDAILGHPHHRFRTIHIAGTNGKGSVSHMIASILQQHGFRTGLYTSPHLRDFRERIKVNGSMISEQEVIDFVARHRTAMDKLQLSFFEMTVGLAFDHFARQKVDIAVIETGLGGRLDSTNIISPLLSVITNIGFDHMQYLGDTLPKIATEKAGIIKHNIPVVIGETNPLTAPVFTARATEMEAPIVFADQTYRCTPLLQENRTVIPSKPASEPACRTQTYTVNPIGGGNPYTVDLDLLGDYQQRNLATVLTAIDILNRSCGLGISQKETAEGAQIAAHRTGLLGRWQILANQPLTVCDTGHNAHGLRWVAAQLAHQQYDHLYIVLGMVEDKDLSQALPLLPREAYYIFTQASIRRALPAADLQAAAAQYGLHGEAVPGVQAAYTRAQELALPHDMIFIGGSTFTVADLLS